MMGAFGATLSMFGPLRFQRGKRAETYRFTMAGVLMAQLISGPCLVDLRIMMNE